MRHPHFHQLLVIRVTQCIALACSVDTGSIIIHPEAKQSRIISKENRRHIKRINRTSRALNSLECAVMVILTNTLRTPQTTKHIGLLQLLLNHLNTSGNRIMKFKTIHIIARHVTNHSHQRLQMARGLWLITNLLFSLFTIEFWQCLMKHSCERCFFSKSS
jgi:hypothetical protein